MVETRDMEKATKVREKIQDEIPNAEVILLEIDLSSLASVNIFFLEFLALECVGLGNWEIFKNLKF